MRNIGGLGKVISHAPPPYRAAPQIEPTPAGKGVRVRPVGLCMDNSNYARDVAFDKGFDFRGDHAALSDVVVFDTCMNVFLIGKTNLL